MTSNCRTRIFRSDVLVVMIALLLTLGVAGCRKPDTKPEPAAAAEDADAGPAGSTMDMAEFDLEQGRVFIPERGWVDADSFWEIYYEYPRQLPPVMKAERLTAFKEAWPADAELSGEVVAN